MKPRWRVEKSAVSHEWLAYDSCGGFEIFRTWRQAFRFALEAATR